MGEGQNDVVPGPGDTPATGAYECDAVEHVVRTPGAGQTECNRAPKDADAACGLLLAHDHAGRAAEGVINSPEPVCPERRDPSLDPPHGRCG